METESKKIENRKGLANFGFLHDRDMDLLRSLLASRARWARMESDPESGTAIEECNQEMKKLLMIP